VQPRCRRRSGRAWTRTRLRQGDEATRRAFETAPSALGCCRTLTGSVGWSIVGSWRRSRSPTWRRLEIVSVQTWTLDAAERHVRDVLRTVEGTVPTGVSG
jgi:hypothetical protein